MSGIELDIAHKGFGGAPVIEGLHLSVAAGEIVALIGPSGTGKTTLLNILAGLDRDYRGSLRWDGRPLPEANPRLGMVFQEPRLLPWLSLRDNIRLVLRERADERVARLLAAVGLAEQGDALPRALSGGMQRRAALARAFAVEPQLLLLDEPFVSLDQPSAERLRELLLGLWRELRPTVVLVSHDLTDAVSLAQRMVFLSRAPARVLLEQPLTGSRDQRQRTAEAALMAHPELLSGDLRTTQLRSCS